MNKIIPILSVMAIYGCATKPITTTDLTTKPSPSVSVDLNSDQQHPAIDSKVSSHNPVKRNLIANRPLRQHTILSLQKPQQYQQVPKPEPIIPRITRYIKQGIASWYGRRFHGRKTATGEIFDMYAMTAAHKTLPIPSYAQVTNLENNRSVIVRINDRGPYVGNRLLDLSYAAAKKLDMHKNGLGRVEIVALSNDQALTRLNKASDETGAGPYLKVGSIEQYGDRN